MHESILAFRGLFFFFFMDRGSPSRSWFHAIWRIMQFRSKDLDEGEGEEERGGGTREIGQVNKVVRAAGEIARSWLG